MDAADRQELIGRRLATIRERRGLSQSAVARQFGHPQSWLAKIEAGDRRLLYVEGINLLDFYCVAVDILDPAMPSVVFLKRLDELGDDGAW